MKLLPATFEFCPQCGSPTQRPVENPFACPQCNFVFYFSPTVAVGAIITRGDEILFLVRGKDPGKGKLGLPGGFVDAGETLESSLAREVFEEASLTVIEHRYVCSYPNQYLYRGVQVEVIDSFFQCEIESFDSLSAQAGEVDGFRWAKPDHATLDQLAFESNRRAIKTYLKKCTTTSGRSPMND